MKKIINEKEQQINKQKEINKKEISSRDKEIKKLMKRIIELEKSKKSELISSDDEEDDDEGGEK